MQLDEKTRKEAVEEIYLILAEFYKFPDEAFFEEVESGEIDQRLEELYKIAGYLGPTLSLADRFSNLNKMKKAFIDCFLGGANSYAPPVESLYKVWTTDASADIGMANQKGYLFGDSALHIRHLFEEYELEIPEDYKNMPDHLTLLLEFLGFMISNSSDTEMKQYLHDHFDWLGDFKQELSKIENSSFYLDITDIVIQAIDDEIKWLEQKNIIS